MPASTADKKKSRLYLEIMREAILLGDTFLVEMVSMRLADLHRSPVFTAADSNVIPFPQERLAAAAAFQEGQKLWMTVFLTAMIPLGILLFLVAFNFLTHLLLATCPG